MTITLYHKQQQTADSPLFPKSLASFFKFASPTQLALKANKPVLRLLDICYGLGYNTAAALQKIWTVNPNCYVEVIGLELNASVPQAAIAHQLFDNWS
jgi:tRNA U34 5-methylaminomethyl-2-thiouridine-forming methyltransferase MnmC